MTLDNRALPAETAQDDSAPAPAASTAHEAWLVRLVRELAIHDWVVLVYLTILTVAVAVLYVFL